MSLYSDDILDNLVEARLRDQLVGLPDIGGSMDEALAAQCEVVRRLQKRGESIAGWKLGLTSGTGRDLFGPAIRPFGYILSSRTFRSGSILHRKQDVDLHLEAEMCLKLSSDLSGPDPSRGECLAAVGEIGAAFEINQYRVPVSRRNLFIADGLSNWGLVVGSGSSLSNNFAIPGAEMFMDGRKLGESGPDYPVDDPILSLSRLCHVLHCHGLGLKAGETILTGALVRHEISEPGEYSAHFREIGHVALNVHDA